ncbi:MAG TPA: rhombosortase, partial [Burkholderiaceae bacterium]|nr:rhombosortase [Burkholderiaceae bacterium]
ARRGARAVARRVRRARACGVMHVPAGGRAWLGVAALLAAGALAGWPVAHEAIDWQPGLASTQPWRAFTAIGVHYSALHLAANLAGTALVGCFGAVARVPRRCAWAWLAAWPLTQFGLLLKPELLHYGGLSGVLHAGVAIVGIYLLATGARAQRGTGARAQGALAAAVLVGLVAKLLSEAPWGDALRHPAGWDIAVAPLAHATGALAGVITGAIGAAIALRLPRRAA